MTSNTYQIRKDFYNLKNHANLKKPEDIHLCIFPKPVLNASESTIKGASLITISNLDIKMLSRADLLALFSHELGHIKGEKELNRVAVDLFLAVSFFLLLGTFVMLDLKCPTVYFISFTFFICMISAILFTLVPDHLSEKIADTFGANLVGKDNYIHMLRTFKNYDKHKIDTAINLTKKLWLVPSACFTCIMLIFGCLLLKLFEFIHTPWQNRINRLKS